MKYFAVMIILVICGFQFTNADEKKPEVQMRAAVEFIKVSQELVTDTLYGELSSKSDEELRKYLQSVISEDKAIVLETLILTMRSGEKATSESIQEYINPTQYEVNTQDEGTSFAVNPIALEQRNLGATLEMEPTYKNGMIDVRFAPELVYFVQKDTWESSLYGKPNVSTQFPRFYTIRMNTGFTVKPSKPFLVGVHTPKDEKGTPDLKSKVMVFVKVDVLE